MMQDDADAVAATPEHSRGLPRIADIARLSGVSTATVDRVLNHRRHGLAMEGRIDGLELEIAEGVGHMPQYAQTERVVAFIRRIAERAFPA